MEAGTIDKLREQENGAGRRVVGRGLLVGGDEQTHHHNP